MRTSKEASLQHLVTLLQGQSERSFWYDTVCVACDLLPAGGVAFDRAIYSACDLLLGIYHRARSGGRRGKARKAAMMEFCTGTQVFFHKAVRHYSISGGKKWAMWEHNLRGLRELWGAVLKVESPEPLRSPIFPAVALVGKFYRMRVIEEAEARDFAAAAGPILKRIKRRYPTHRPVIHNVEQAEQLLRSLKLLSD